MTEREMEFDMIGIDCAIANSLRRIMLSEVYEFGRNTIWFRP